MARLSLNPPGVRTAIVVDDSRMMRLLLGRALELRGYRIVEAEDGKDALVQLAALPELPELALIDLNMPEMNGLELVRRLRSERCYDQMVIVMVTSETDPVQIERALEVGADEYLMKPLSEQILFEKLTLLEESGEVR